ncbi:MFS general substrate transporter [Boletus reticuloceps]|uniref:MFS general substrate transporter n=1 Tax=Boletus reticuloceps TaxID=495285 RepID=A0A8I2YPC9_9AGAM|nr:MFS general substrate transporter [Boletus reticuloceps]
MADIEKQTSLPTRHSSLEGTTCESSSRNSTLKPETPSIPSADDNAHSRLRAWLAVFGGFLALFCSFGQLTAFGAFQTWYSGHQLASMSLFGISWIGSLQLWMFFFMGGPIGCVFDAYGPTPILCSGSLILVASLVLTSISVQYYQYLLAQGLVFGMGVAMLFYPTMACVATHFNEYRATAIGIVSAGSGCGGVLYPIMLRYLFSKFGFGWAVRFSALVTAVMCAVVVLTVRLQRPINKRTGIVLEVQTIQNRRFLLLVVGSFFVCLGMFTPYFYISDYAQSRHMSSKAAFCVLSIMNAGSVFGRIAPAWLSDKIGRFNLLCPCAFLSGLTCLVFWMFGEGPISIIVFAALYGFLSGAVISVVNPCVSQISHMREIGTRIGALYTLISVPCVSFTFI